jgi:PST family polysaccharide transporter
MTSENSKKQIVKSSAIVGGAAFLTILIGLVRVKVVALLLGPAGIGLMGIFSTIMATGAVFFSMGLDTSGVRELALSNKSVEKLDLVRKALFSAKFLLGLFAIMFILIYSATLSEWFFKSSDYQLAICILAVGIFFSLISGSQTTLLQGLRKITSLAKVKVIGTLASTIIGLLILWRMGESGLPYFVIALPLVSFFVALYYCQKLPKLTTSTFSFKHMKQQWQTMFTLGFAFMLASLMEVVSQLIVRFIVNQELDIDSVGYFQAAWAISMTYISFVLGAMAADYYPRLTEQIHNRQEANRLVNEQTEIAIIFAAPILLAMLAFAPLVINLLYSSDFTDSIEILRWQVFGDVLKVISWPLGFIILAKGRSKLFFCTQLLWNASYVLLVYLAINDLGITITGYAFAVSYLIYIVVVYVVASKSNGFSWTKKNIKLILLLTFSALSLLLLSYFSRSATMALGFFLVLGSTIYAIKMIAELGIKNHKLEKLLTIYKKCAYTLGFKK